MPRKPNVLIMVDSFDMGGAEGQAVLLARLLLEDGRYGVHLATLKREGALLNEALALGLGEIPEYRLTSFYDRNMLVQLRRFRSFLQSREIDVVHPQSFYTNIFGITGAALVRVPVRIAFRGEITGWRTPAQDLAERWAFRLATVVHANSEAVKNYLVANGVPSRKVVTVYNGLDMARVTVAPDLQRDQACATLGLPSNRPLITLIANLRHEVKDHRMFLRAAEIVHREAPEAAFVLAGEGELMPEMRALAAQMKIEQDTFFLGRCDDIATLLFVSDVCVLSSKAEGFSNAILEYMAAARPVVATNVGGAAEAIAEGESGYLVSSGDHAAMAYRITFLVRNPETARKMGKLGREIVAAKFSSRAQLQNTSALYDRLLARKEARKPVDARESVV